MKDLYCQDLNMLGAYSFVHKDGEHSLRIVQQKQLEPEISNMFGIHHALPDCHVLHRQAE